MREQAEKLGIMKKIETMMNSGADFKSPQKGNFFKQKEGAENLQIKKNRPPELDEIHDNLRKHKQALRKELEERKKLKRELTKLEERKNNFRRAQEPSKQLGFAQKRQNSDEKLRKPPTPESKERLSADAHRSYSDKEKPKKEQHMPIVNKATPYVRETPKKNKHAHDYGYQPSRGGKSEEKGPKKGNYFRDTNSGSERSNADSDSNSNKISYDKLFEGIKETRKHSGDSFGSKERKKPVESLGTGETQAEHSKPPKISDYNDARERVLLEKERKKKEEQLRIENELKNIREENNEARKLAQEKKMSLFKPSQDNLLSSPKELKSKSEINKGLSGFAHHSDGDHKKEPSDNEDVKFVIKPLSQGSQSCKPLKIEEDKDMYADDFESDKETEHTEEEELGLEKIEEKINVCQQRLTHNATKILDLKKSLKHTKQ